MFILGVTISVQRTNVVVDLIFCHDIECLHKSALLLTFFLKGGEPNYFWQQPNITSETRAFFDDITTEISIQLQLRPLTERQASKNFTFLPIPAERDIKIILGYLDYP